MSFIEVTEVNISGRRINVKFACSSELEPYFKSNKEFWSDYNSDLTDLPLSVALVPFVCNVLPIVWLTNSILELDRLDKDFYESIEKFKAGYIKMYPEFEFKGCINVKILEYNQKKLLRGQSCGAFFSGGVDAFATLIAHIYEHPDLITVWGSDITTEDTAGWARVWNHTVSTGRQMGLKCLSIKTNFRTFINNRNLDLLCIKCQDSWWHGFQHGIGLIGLSAPIAWVQGYDIVYIASSFSEADRQRGKITCASDPDIDGNVRFSGCKVIHDQFEYSRQEKVNHICDFADRNKLKLDVRVCYAIKGGVNCCACEKCIRTIIEIIAAGSSPKNYGFVLDAKLIKGYKRTVVSRVNHITLPFWEDIQRHIKDNPRIKLPKELEWIKTIDIMKEKQSVVFKVYLFIHKAKGKFYRIFKN